MCGFSASWKVQRLQSAASLMASDWLMLLNSTLRCLVTLLIANCTAADKPPTMKSALVLLDQLQRARRGLPGVEPVVAHQQLRQAPA